MSVAAYARPYRSAGRRAVYPHVALAVFLLGLPAPLAPAGDAGEGRRIAETWCVGCHLIDDASRAGVADVTTSFAVISADPAKTPAYLRTFLANPRHPMPDFSLTRQEIENIVAYITGLAPDRD